MKKTMLLLALCALVFTACESEFGEYPIAGKSYKTAADEDGDYIIYKFASSGKLYTDYYYDGEYEFGVVDYWWMEGDSIFAESEKEREDKIKTGCYHGNYIHMNWRNAYLINTR